MIYFVGDPHGCWDLIIPPILERRPSAIVLLGDMELVRPLHVEMRPVLEAGIKVHFIPGNHDGDDPEGLAYLLDSNLAGNNLSGRIQLIAGLNIAGLGGVFRQKIWNPKFDPTPRHKDRNSLRRSDRGLARDVSVSDKVRDGIPFRHHVAIWPDDYARLRRQRADILVLHEAPECHPYGFRALGELAEAMKVKMVIHGHHHQHYLGTTERGIPVVGVSLAGIVDQDGELIAPGLTGYRASGSRN